MSGIYTMSICVSTALGAGLTPPIFDAIGSWQWALLFWAFPAATVVLLWLAPIVRERGLSRGTAGLIVVVSIVLQMAGFSPHRPWRCVWPTSG